MEVTAMLARLSMCVVLLLCFWHGTHGARMLGPLPPCTGAIGEIPNWNCYSPPATPLPPCDVTHHSPGIDCKPPASKVTELTDDTPLTRLRPCDPNHDIDCETGLCDCTWVPPTSEATQQMHVSTQSGVFHRLQGPLPPCTGAIGEIPNWNCYSPPSTPLPPCDYTHHSPGIDCKPPASKVTELTDDAAQSGVFHRMQGPLPPCTGAIGEIPNWNCYSPPATPLPPCDFTHHSPGIDCKPPASKFTELTDESAQSGVFHHVQGALPLPPCDPLRIDCETGLCDCTWSPPTSGATQQKHSPYETDVFNLPSCKDVPGGIQGWNCYDPPSTPLPPCDAKHRNPGIDCRTYPPAARP